MYLSWVMLPFLWGVTWYVVTIASLAVGYIYLICCHLWSFASYDRPSDLKIKYPLTRFLSFSVSRKGSFCMLLYERFSTFTVSLLYEHSLDRFLGWFSYCVFYISEFSSCLLYHSHPFCWWRHNKEGRTRVVLTHPNCGCLLHDKCFIFVWAG